MKTAVIILNFNTCGYLKRFLPRMVESIAGCDAEIIVADNGSTDGSVEMMKTEFPEVKTVFFDENHGFTGGYNLAVEQISEKFNPQYVVLINSDIEVPDGWLQPLVTYMDTHPECGVCGPLLHVLEKSNGDYIRSERFEYAGAAGGYLDRFGFPFCRGRVLKRTEMDTGQYPEVKNVLWVSGACLLTRTALWKEYGGLDNRFFAHMEEIDYCWRIALAGYRTSVIPESTVYHIGAGTLPQTSDFKLKLNYRNNLLMLDNNLASSIGQIRASVRISVRKALDYASAIAYLLTGSASKAKAVFQAHKEYRQLKKKYPCKHSKTDVCGLTNIMIIPTAFLYGERIFKKVSRI